MVVEDEPDLLETLTMVVESLFDEVEIFTAIGGRPAQEILSENSEIDLIITDIMMAKGDGVELLSYCEGNGLNTPIIVYHGSEKYAEELENASRNCVAIVHKPHVRQLKKAILSAVELN